MKKFLFCFCMLSYFFISAQTSRGAEAVNLVPPKVIAADSTFALLIGVSEYEFIQKLNFAHSDAQLFYQFLTSKNGANIPAQNVKLLTNKAVTRSAFLNNIYSFLAKNAASAKRIIIFFAGHGDADAMGEQYLLTSACDPANDVNNYGATDAVSVSELKTKIKFLSGKGVEVLLFIDACRTNNLLRGSSPGALDISSGIEQVNGEMLFLSCEKGQVSQEGAQWNGHGIFTYYLIQGFNGKADKNNDHSVSLEEIKRYTDNAVYNDANNKSGQTPVFRYNQLSNYNLFNYTAADETIFASNNISLPSGSVYRSAQRISNKTISDANVLKFNTALASKKFLEPENDCANFYIEQMRKAKLSSDAVNNAANTLALELLDSCMRIMNLYISGADNLGNYKYRMGKIFTNGKILFAEAKKLLANINPEVTQANRTMELFFDARSVLEIEPTDARVAKLPDALTAVNEALSLKPNAAYLHHLKSLLLNAMGKKEDAITSEKQAIKLAPNWIYPYNTLAGVYYSSRQWGDAMNYYNSAKQIDSNSFLPYLGLGNAYKKQGKFNDAIVYYNKAIQKDSLNPAAYHNRGLFYVHRNEADKGKKDFEQCLKIDDRFYDAYLGLATYYELKGNYTTALKQYETAIKIDRAALSDLQSNIASLEMLGRTDVAEMYRKAYEQWK